MKKTAKLCAIALAICVLSPVAASGAGAWTALPAAASSGEPMELATSSNGQIIYSLELKKIRFSTNGGTSWSDRDSGIDWSIEGSDIATSADGSLVVVTAQQNPEGYYVSLANVRNSAVYLSNDFGANWTMLDIQTPRCTRAQGAFWANVSVSDSGEYIALTELCKGSVWISSDFGAVFTERLSSAALIPNISDIEISGSGSRMILSTNDNVGSVYLSTNYGSSFNVIGALNFPTAKNWLAVEVSADGMTMLATSAEENVWISKNGGTTWQERDLPGNPFNVWLSGVTISADGKIIGLSGGAKLFISEDSGTSWREDQTTGGTYDYSNNPGGLGVGMASSQDGSVMYALAQYYFYNSTISEIYKSPTVIPPTYDSGVSNAGTVTFNNSCPANSSKVTSVQAQSVLLVLDTATVASDTSTYHYYTETNTALWGATYDYGTKQAVDCSYLSMTGSMTLDRGPFIASSGASYSETSTPGANSDFIQYIGNLNETGTVWTHTNACGNTNVTNLNVANKCDFSSSTGTTRQFNWPALSQGTPIVIRTGVAAGTSLSKTASGLTTGLDPATVFVIVKAKKTLIAAAPARTSWVATETFTVTSA